MRKLVLNLGLAVLALQAPIFSDSYDSRLAEYERTWDQLKRRYDSRQNLLNLISAQDWLDLKAGLKAGESAEDLRRWVENQGPFRPVFKALRFYTAPKRKTVRQAANQKNAKNTIAQSAIQKQYAWYLQHEEELQALAQSTSVNPEVLASICYAETRLSQYELPHRVIDAVFTLNGLLRNGILANESTQLHRIARLKRLARASLLSLYRFERQNEFPVADLRSSWAGAVGPMQLMPFNFYHLADGSLDGVIDPENMLDSLSGAASFLKAKGWGARQNWLFRQDINRKELVEILMKYNSSRAYAEGVLEAALRLRSLILKNQDS